MRDVCRVEGCYSEATRVKWQLCEKHHARLRRHGSTDKANRVKPGSLIHNGGGYLMDRAPGHPLETSSSRVYQHRIVFYATHGDGPFQCYHCGTPQTWATMHIDHLDDNPKNNCITNLVASCPVCNQRRGYHKMVATRRSQGRMIEWDGQTHCLNVWASMIGISAAALSARLQNWTLQDAMTKPRGVTGPRSKCK